MTLKQIQLKSICSFYLFALIILRGSEWHFNSQGLVTLSKFVFNWWTLSWRGRCAQVINSWNQKAFNCGGLLGWLVLGLYLKQEPLVADDRSCVPTDDLRKRQLPAVTQHHWHTCSLRRTQRKHLRSQSQPSQHWMVHTERIKAAICDFFLDCIGIDWPMINPPQLNSLFGEKRCSHFQVCMWCDTQKNTLDVWPFRWHLQKMQTLFEEFKWHQLFFPMKWNCSIVWRMGGGRLVFTASEQYVMACALGLHAWRKCSLGVPF